MIERAMNFVTFSQVAGDYLEFGVYEGGTLINAWHAAALRPRFDAI